MVKSLKGGLLKAPFLYSVKKAFIDGFEDGLIGAKAGDDLTVEGNFPDDYNAEHLAGKTAQFDVSVKEVGNRPNQRSMMTLPKRLVSNRLMPCVTPLWVA